MTDRMIVMLMMVMPILAGLTVGIGGVWLTGELRVFGLVILVAVLAGAGLVGYFDWRTRLRRRIVGDAQKARRAA